MRIAYTTNSRFPSERAHMTQIVAMCNAMAELGHEVTLFVTDRETLITESPEAYYGVTLRFSVKRVFVPDFAGRTSYFPRILQPFLFFIQRIIFTLCFRFSIKTKDIDLIYGRDEWVLSMLSFIVKTPLIWESHEAKFSLGARALMKKMKYTIVISEGIYDFYVSHGVQALRLHVAHDAVDDRFFEPFVPKEEAQALLGIKTSKPIVMYIGGFEAWKGTQTLFEASKQDASFDVVVIGGSDDEVHSAKEKYPGIAFLGRRPYRELPVNQQAADILVIPNTATVMLSAQYTSPLKLFTYMTAKKIIIASRIPSITRVLRDDEAYFFTPDDPVSLCTTINEALKDKDRAKDRMLKAYARSREYTWKARAQGILKLWGS
jgi:glycosyltransferase involved in cell wall biosynthesis